jgi:hypothetical protein
MMARAGVASGKIACPIFAKYKRGMRMGKQAFPPVSMPYYQNLETAQR